ncbi:type 1 fimbria pilin [Acinetobacter sp. BIGb0196]|jgi:type 1 fimbria pilin|nr:type 1 fimbria pilin [Acinetobacter guillouiae]MCW2252920.1 type 1 fimbria pilin [Acinetobacter sp. BIGb0204]NII36312.1 type 1 fimbria pilin [Acinetobacter sp. BIGb0196]
MSPNVNHSIVKLSHLLKLYKAGSMNKLTLPTFSTLLLTLVCTSVFAVDGTITVNGVITDGTCILQGSSGVSGNKDLTVTMPTVSKSNIGGASTKIVMELRNADGTANCDAITSNALQGIHLSASPTDLASYDKTLLLNKATGVGGASTANPIFMRIETDKGVGLARRVDFSAPWGTQAKSYVNQFRGRTWITYYVVYFTWNWIVDAQNVTATINYTLHYN